jgi:hypothetical protein
MILEISISCRQKRHDASSACLCQEWAEWADGPFPDETFRPRIQIRSGPESEVLSLVDFILLHRQTLLSMKAEGFLVVRGDTGPGPSLYETLRRLLREDRKGWWFSVSPPDFLAHNLLVKAGTTMRPFEMDGVFSYDSGKAMFYNEISRSHFLHSQDAPQIFTEDGRLCFVARDRFDADCAIPYRFGEADLLKRSVKP